MVTPADAPLCCSVARGRGRGREERESEEGGAETAGGLEEAGLEATGPF